MNKSTDRRFGRLLQATEKQREGNRTSGKAQMNRARSIMKKRRNALRELAK